MCVFVYWYGPIPKAFVYWYGWDRTVPLLVRVVIVYSQPDRFKSGSLWNYPTIWGQKVVLERLEPFVYYGPVRTKLKWFVPIKRKHPNKSRYRTCTFSYRTLECVHMHLHPHSYFTTGEHFILSACMR
jgi:hypothetical protein